MSGEAPTPRIFGREQAARAENPRSSDQMVQGRNLIGGPDASQPQGWWTQEPQSTSLATTTGQNLEGTSNAFDTNFWARAQEQDEAQTSLAGRWDRGDATGVVTYNSGREGVKFGDVFVDGKKAGNVYQGYAGMTNTDADEIMARLVLPREVWARAYESEAGRPLTFTGSLREELAAAEKQRSEDFEKGWTAAEFEGEVEERAAGMEESGAWQVGNVAAGAAGGALTGTGFAAVVTAVTGGVGAVAAPFIIGGFALAGGIGSYLNRDSAFRSSAVALEQWELATKDGHQALGYADAAAGVAGALAEKLNPVRNLLQGGYDATVGEIGDGESSYQSTETPLWMQGADMGALLIDGVGSFGSSIARRAYTTVMGANVATGQASVAIGTAEGTLAFNPYSGQYEDIGAAGMAQRQASVGIDLVQTGAAGMLGRVVRGVRGGSDVASVGGHVISTVGGVQSARLGWSALIPSEAATGLAARTLARRTVRQEGLEASRENLRIATARHIENLTTGRKTIATAAVNGFGEGAEEFVQAALDATAFGETPTFRELVEAAKTGAGMGFGMGVAIGAGSRSRSQVYLDRANTMRAVRGEEPIEAKEWEKFSESEQAQAGTVRSADEQKLYDLTVRQLVREGSRVAGANIPELRRAVETARAIAEQETRNSQDLVEPSRLQVRSNHEWGPQDYVVSLVAATRDVEARQALMAATAAGDPIRGAAGAALVVTPEEREQAGKIAAADEALLRRLRQVADEIDQVEDDPAAVRAILNQLNTQLQGWWTANEEVDELAYGMRRSASVWGARFPLNSAGSFQLLRLQISPELTLEGANNTVLVPDEILAPTGGDFDGDRFVSLLRELLPTESYQMLRWGAGQLTSSGTMLSEKPYVLAATENVFDGLQEPGSPRYAAVLHTQAQLRRRLNAVLAPSPIPPAIRRRLVDATVKGLSSRDTGAMRRLFDQLAVQHAPAMRELAQRMDGSPYLALNRVIEDELRLFMDAWSTTTVVTSRTGGTTMLETNKNMPRWRPTQVRQTSDLLEGATRANKFDIFRLQTVLKYNARREATQTSPEETADVLADLFRTFTARNDGMVRPGEDAMFDGTIAQERTISWLQNIAREAQPSLGTHTVNEALVMLAGANVDDVDTVTRVPRSSGEVRLVQALLHEVVTGLRSELAEVMGKDPAIATRLASLDSLTRPDFMDGSHTHAQGGDAFVEVLGAMPVFELLGEQGAAINTWTVRGLRDYLLGLRADVREEFVDRLQAHPSYSAGDGLTPYRVLVDNVIESARMQLSENRETGLPSGALTRSSATASENFKTTYLSVRKVANARGVDMSTPAKVRAFLASDMRLSVAVLNLIEERGVRAGVVQRTQDGSVSSVQFPQWIYDVFAAPEGRGHSDTDAARAAEMRLLEQTLVMAKAGLQSLDANGNPTDQLDPQRVGDRVLRLWLDLDYRAADKTNPRMLADRQARDDFLRLLTESRTTDDFIGALNLDLRFRDEHSAPYVAWARDRSIVEPSRFSSGVSSVQEGTGMRDALRDAANIAATVLHDEETVQAHFEENRELLSQLKNARDGGPDAAGAPLWNRFVSWFELAKDLPVMVGASVWIQQAAHINEILGNMGVKGISPDNVAPLGRAIAAQLPTFDSAVGQLLGSMTSGSMGSLLTDTTQLARGERTIVLNDGTVVDWAGMTPERALDLLMDPDTAGLASRMLGMTAWDYNEDLGQNILVSIVGRGVAGFTQNPEESLFGRDSSSKLRRLMTLEAMSTSRGGTPFVPLILATQMNIREAALDHPISDRTGEREEMAVSILEEIADALDALSRVEGLYARTETGGIPLLSTTTDEVTGEDTTLLNQLLLNVGRRARQAKGVDNFVARLLPADPAMREIGETLLQQWSAGYAQKAAAANDPVMLEVARRIAKDLRTIDEVASPLDVLLETYGNYTTPQVQTLLTAHVKAAGEIVQTAAWARTELLRVQDAQGTPNLTTDQWEKVARAVIAHTMHTSYGIATRSDSQVALFPSLKNRNELEAQREFWDPTFVEPALNVFAPGIMRKPDAAPSPLLTSQLELVRAMGPQLPTVSRDDAEKALYKLVAPLVTDAEGRTSGTTGQWHGLIPALMHSAQGAVLASAAEAAISMAGLNPGRLAYLAAATRQDWTARPPDAELSTATIPASQIVAAVAQGHELSSAIEVTLPGVGPQGKVLAQLQGRVVRQLGITVPGGARTSLLANARYGSGLLLPPSAGVLAGEAGVVDLQTLQHTVTSWLRDNGIPRDQWDAVQVDVSFFHPDTKATSTTRAPGADYDHNPWFDGVAARTDAAFSQQSLIGSFFFGLDGVIATAYDTALGAIKKLSFALQQVTEMPEAYRRAQLELGRTDMAAMLDRMTDFAMRQKVDNKAFDVTAYNSIRKILSLLYVVRYIDETGGPLVISAETAIAMQARGEALPDTAQVVGLPMQHVLTLMGEHDAADMIVAPWGDLQFSPDVSRVPQYQRFPVQAWTPEMFGGLTAVRRDAEGNVLGWGTVDLLDQPVLRNQALPRARVRSYRGQTRHSSKDFFGPYRRHAEAVHDVRQRHIGATTHWAEQKARAASKLRGADANIAARVMQAVQAVVDGQATDAASLMSRPMASVSPTNDFTTGWWYIHKGTRVGGLLEGVLTTTADVSNVMIGDDVFIQASTFLTLDGQTDPAEAFGAARTVLDELMGTGVTIHLPADAVASDLRRKMASYLRERNYAEESRGSGTFVPQPTAARTQAVAAFHSTLNGATQRTSRNRAPLFLSPHILVNENSIYPVNGGLGSLETYDLREVVQTARYAGYGPQLSPEKSQREHLINVLLPILQSASGPQYLARQSGIDPADLVTTNELVGALERLEARLIEARANPRLKLLPEAGEEFGTGDLIPLVSYNDRNQLVGVHLYRHGHQPVDEQVLRGAALPQGNAELGADGVRLTIDKAEIDPLHTAHRGEVVERKWLGMQGFVMRIRAELSSLGAKVFEAGTGMKWTTTPPPADLTVPSHQLFAGRAVKGVADLASPQAKTSDGGWLNTIGDIAEAVGFDVMPHLVRLLKNVDFDQDGAEAYSRAENEVREALRTFRARNAGSVDAATLVAGQTDQFATVLAQQLQAQLEEALDARLPDFLAEHDTQRTADITMTRLVLSALASGADLTEVLGAPGYVGAQPGTASHTMHPVFTTLLHRLPVDHSARIAFVDQINARIPWDGQNGFELLPNLTWVMHSVKPDGTKTEMPGMLALPSSRPADTNDALTEMGQGRKQAGSVSGTTLAMAYTTWAATPLLEKPLQRGSSVFTPNEFLHDGETGARKFFFNNAASSAPFIPQMDDDLRMNQAEARHIFGTALPRRRALSVAIETDGWYADMDKAKRRQAEGDYRRLFNRTLRTLKLNKADSLYLTEMIRSVLARPATAPGEAEYMTYREAMAALKLIQRNAARGDMPTHGGAVNVVSRAALSRLHEVGYPLTRGDGKARPVEAWDDWIDVMLSEAFSADVTMRGYPAVSNIVDGLLYEYRADVKGLPATVQNRLQGVLSAVRSRSGLLVASPVQRREFDAPGVQDGEIVDDIEAYATLDWEFEQLPQDARALVEARMTKWENDHGLKRRRQSPRQEAIRGAQPREDLARTNVFMRFAQLGYVIKTLANPGLYASAFVELANKAGQESLVSFLTGENLRAQGFTPEQRKQWEDTQARLAQNAAFYGMVYQNTNYRPEGDPETRLEARLQRGTNFLTAMFNDPTWGTTANAMARSFMEAAWDSVSKSSERAVTIEQFLDTLAADPTRLATISPDAVAHGYSRIEYRRNLQDNLAERMRRRVVEGVINSGGPGTNTLGVLLLRFPTMFFRFRSNTLINLMGMQAPHAVLTQLMSDRTRRSGGLRAGVLGEDNVSDTARIEDSYDLTRAIVRTGVSHTQLMILGMVLSAAGFGGDEEDEEKLLDKLRRYQQPVVAKDPLALENDFRNAEAWFSKLLPAGMGVPSWVIRPFVSPAMGVARFFETGDIRQVQWGFMDALGNMPLLNADTVLNSWGVANELIAAAEAASQEESDEATQNASRLLFTAIGTLEAMLFESAFASMLYQGADEWDRDPYKIPLINAEGEPQLYKNGLPRPTTMLKEFQDPITGETKMGYAQRNDLDAFYHQLAENRPVFATVMSLVMQDSSFIRYNMVPKMREVDAAPITQDEAEQVIVSILNNATGSEELTAAGAEGVIRGIHLGTVALDSPALNGVFIPNEMRFEIQNKLLGELTLKYVTLGYGKSEALSKAKAEWYGQAYGEPEGLGLADILWSDAIPDRQTQTYLQLNTTYVMGPNGRPIATGLQRSVLDSIGMNPEGLGIFQTYMNGRSGDLPTDQLLNSVDPGRSLNLGQRGLVKLDESWITPTAEEIGAAIEDALDDIADKLDDLNDPMGGGWNNGWRNFGRGGGGGGYSRGSFYTSYGGQSQRLNTPRGFRAPYAMSPRTVNTPNPFVRRATIKQERFSAQRGRLNQWQ